MPSIGWLRAISNGTVHAAEPPSALAGVADNGQGNQQGEQGQSSEGPPHPLPQSAIGGASMSPTTPSLAAGWR